MGVAKISPQTFIYISVSCPAGSYDPNLTPMKDEIVLFEEQTILDMLESLCASLYQPDTVPGTPSVTRPSAVARNICNLAGEVEPSNVLKQGDKANHKPSSAVAQLLTSEVTSETEEAIERHSRSCSENKLVRTAMSVNMLRTKSDATDDACEEGMVSIDIAHSPTPVVPEPASKTDKLVLTPAGVSLLSQDIQKYFQPRSDPSFVIAEDDTATPVEPDTSKATSPTPPAVHRPLRRMTEAALNEDHACDDDVDDDFGESIAQQQNEFETLPTSRVARGGFQGVHLEGQREHATRRITDSEARPSPSDVRLGLRSSPKRPRWAGPFVTAPQGVQAPQTPPSTGLRRTRGLNLPNTIHGTQLGRWARESPTIGPRVRAFAGCGKLGPLPGSPTQVTLAGNFRPLTLPATPTSFDHLRQASERTSASADVRVPNRVEKATGSPQGSSQGAKHDESPARGYEPWGLRSRQTQLRLMQTPAPDADSDNGQAHTSHGKRTAEEAFPSTTRGTSTSSHGVACEDPRQYLIKQRRLSAANGRRRRMISKQLPLENVGDATHQLKMAVEVNMLLMREVYRDNVFDERLSLMSSLEASDELDLMEVRLAAIVHPWLEKTRPGVSVKWSLRSSVKGKGKSVDRRTDLREVVDALNAGSCTGSLELARLL